jgi:two-component system response regulator AtoC
MPDSSKKVLVIDDEDNMRHMLSALLANHGYSVDTAADGMAGLNLMENHAFDFVLCDIKMPNMNGMAFLEAAATAGHPATVIMMSAYGTVDTAIEAMKRGAYDYISKPFKADEVVLVLKKAEERERLRRENVLLKKKIATLESTLGFGTMIGKSRVMQDIFQLADNVAQHITTVLITGESGTGKELVARGIHNKSPRASKPFVAVNCGSIPENLLESEFFGHVRGAFTGADQDRKGLFEGADGGTLFLDEIGELPLTMQVKLLRVLQEHEIRRVGATRDTKVDVRILAATAKNLADETRDGRFREDLFYRLNVIHIHLPPLKDRTGDIPLLCDYFAKKHSVRMGAEKVLDIAPSAMKLLVQHQWPGNVRELENVIERAVILADKNVILPENLPEKLSGPKQDRRLDDLLGTLSIKEGRKILEHRLITRALESTGGNKSKSAALLEISYPSLLEKIKKYQI